MLNFDCKSFSAPNKTVRSRKQVVISSKFFKMWADFGEKSKNLPFWAKKQIITACV